MHSLGFTPVGYIVSCYKEKFGIPRQPGLIKEAKSQLILNQIFTEECVRGLEAFSHIWLQFIFNGTQQQGWKSMVRPPRLGGNNKVGVFASRSTFRPNPMGLSVLALDTIEVKKSRVILHLLGGDMLDGTPVLDIKPYLPYVDSIPDAKSGYAKGRPESSCDVYFTDEARNQCRLASARLDEDLETLVVNILQLDPRPSYQHEALGKERIYSMKLYDFDLKWQYCENNKIKVLGILQDS
jgi:tRNA-Thr(GGU) m(6)t(6)A37 methyltransferase TsaA